MNRTVVVKGTVAMKQESAPVMRKRGIDERMAEPGGVGASLDDRTIENYWDSLNTTFRALTDAGRPSSPSNIASYLHEVWTEGAVARSSFRTMKSAALFYLAIEAQKDSEAGKPITEHRAAFALVQSLPDSPLKRRTDKTSSPKARQFPPHVLRAVERWVERHRGRQRMLANADDLVAFLRANLHIGLRPAEWFDAVPFSYLHNRADSPDAAPLYRRRPDGGIAWSPAFRVRNEKATFGRGNGSHRILLLDEADAAVMDDILAFWVRVQAQIDASIDAHRRKANPTGAWDGLRAARDWCDGMQTSLRKILKRVGLAEEFYALYSTRHQAVANAKASGLPRAVIAALFGHVSIETASTHYGKRAQSKTIFRLRPAPESIQLVRADYPYLADDVAYGAEPTPQQVLLAEWASQAKAPGNDPPPKRSPPNRKPSS